MERTYKECLDEARLTGELEAAADTDALAIAFLSYFRGLEALGAAGMSREKLLLSAKTAISFLPLTEVGRAVVAGELAPQLA